MIENWELTNWIDKNTGTIHYSLVMDGTDKDAYLMAKKLKGYVHKSYAAPAPYVHGFILPNDLDDTTQERIRTAVKEAVALSQKIDNLVPGGNLGDPLFNTPQTSLGNSVNLDNLAEKQVNLDEATRINLHPVEASAPQAPQPPASPENAENDIDMLEEINPVNLRKQTIEVSAPQDAASTISISDDDMLIKDMEGSMLEKMPLEDILSAQTKYDMFVDVNQTPQQAQRTQQQKEQKMPDAQPPNTTSFNVFEHDLKEQTNVIDVEDVQTITDKLTQKENNMTQIPPSQDDSKPIPPAPQSAQNDLPEITVRADRPQFSPAADAVSSSPAQDPAADPASTPLPDNTPEEEPPHAKTILRLKKRPEPETEQLGKTMLRLRRKGTIPNAPTAPAAQPLRSTVSPLNAAAKQKNIDHSIQIPTSELKKHNWPLEVPLVPTYTLNNMVMSVNRFAHATAISVIENPGRLYNPLVLHGGTGTGKTHFLNALAYAFSKKFGQEHIFMTNGVRLSRGIQRYVMEGNIDKFENFMQSVQALLIDDIHLLAINEQNRAYVSKLLNTFLQEHKQIVITSKYPPESLEKLEELINFRLDSGWISELKPATGATHFRIVKKMLFENGVDLNDKQIEEFFGAPHMTLGTVTRSIRRLKVLENLIFPNMPVEQKSQAGIFEKLLATKGEDPTSEILKRDPTEITSLNIAGNGEWGRIGFFYPQNCSDMMNWMVFALEQRAKELGIEGGFEIVVRSSYATENIISSAFKIANLCDNKKLKGAVILGPQPNSCDPSVRENFYDILTHMLEIMLIRCGIINYEDVRLPSTYVKIISELMR